MFNKWFRNLNQNWRTAIIIVVAIALFLILFRTIVTIYRVNKENEKQALIQNNIQSNRVENMYTNIDAQNTDVNFSYTGNLTQNEQSLIEQFIEYCNNNQTAEAYQMLSEDCKNNLFPTIDYFKTDYIQKVFKEKITAKLEKSLYGNDVYRVLYYTNLLASGGNKDSNVIQDYIYIVRNNDETKLSINQFLYTKQLEKVTETDSLYAKVIKKEVYVDYEIYQVQIKNKLDKTILLSNFENNKTVTLLDKNQVKYSSNIHEQGTDNLILNPGQQITIDIKFTRMYNKSREEGEKITFSNIVTNYEEYNAGEKAQILVFDIML